MLASISLDIIFATHFLLIVPHIYYTCIFAGFEAGKLSWQSRSQLVSQCSTAPGLYVSTLIPFLMRKFSVNVHGKCA